MKTIATSLSAAAALAAPALAAWLFAGRAFSPETLWAAYALAGIFYIAATGSASRMAMPATGKTATAKTRRIRRFPARAFRARRPLRAEKLAA